MPTVLLFHEQYWNNNRHRNVLTPPPGVSVSRGGYPLWQSSIVVHSVIFGPPLELIRRYWRRLVWTWGMVRRLWSVEEHDRAWVEPWLVHLMERSKPERVAYDRMRALMASPAWDSAQAAVRATATTLGFNDPVMWKGLSRALRESPGSAQNTFRHLQAVTTTIDRLKADGVTLTNPDLHLVVELAYHVFAATPKRTMP